VTILTGGSFFQKEKSRTARWNYHRGPPVFPGQNMFLLFLLAEEFAFNQQVKVWVNANHIAFEHHSRSGKKWVFTLSKPALHAKIIQTIHGMTGIESKN